MKQQLSVRIDADLLAWIDAKAEEAHRSRTNMIEKVLMNYRDALGGPEAHTDAGQRLDVLKEAADKYGRLHDFLSETIEGGRLTAADCPDDYQAIVDALVDCVPVADRMAALLKEEGSK